MAYVVTFSAFSTNGLEPNVSPDVDATGGVPEDSLTLDMTLDDVMRLFWWIRTTTPGELEADAGGVFPTLTIGSRGVQELAADTSLIDTPHVAQHDAIEDVGDAFPHVAAFVRQASDSSNAVVIAVS